ncbi:MAG: tRNA (guanosine(46)-N7)-methyltransferase TrmB [Putridiphycobacter sp.]|nr:tRNA (guanosine(46)-N7)-methyltransferase TrmB [Putridiphycobacter sp.]
MAKNKLQHFADMKTMPFVFEPNTSVVMADAFEMKGNWHSDFFKNDHPIVVELGCGKGEYTVALAKLNPKVNYIGIDIKGARIWYGANEVREKKLKNVSFVRTKIDFITSIFAPNEVSEIWLTFSDPQKEKPRKRLTSSLFIKRYREILQPNGIIHLKTDSDLLFEFTLEEIEQNNYNCLQQSWDIYKDLIPKISAEQAEILKIKTNYEEIFSAKGNSIKYCQFKIN